jgi:hypothetical protein
VIALISTHNRLNGFRFVIGEFALMVVVVAPFGIYYAIHGMWLLALIALGIAGNCSVVLVYAVRSLVGGDADVGIRVYTDQPTRKSVARDHPRLLGETLLLTAAVILPLVQTAWTGWELARRRR